MVTVLDHEEDRVPTEEDINEYAEFLGIDIENEKHLMWIAAEGVVAPVPQPWKCCTENGDDVFYFNFETQESVWDHPCDEKYRDMVEVERAKYESGDVKTCELKTSASPEGKPEARKLATTLDESASMDSPSVEIPGLETSVHGRDSSMVSNSRDSDNGKNTSIASINKESDPGKDVSVVSNSRDSDHGRDTSVVSNNQNSSMVSSPAMDIPTLGANECDSSRELSPLPVPELGAGRKLGRLEPLGGRLEPIGKLEPLGAGNAPGASSFRDKLPSVGTHSEVNTELSDFPSDFEGTSPGIGARADSLADTFELSASAFDADTICGVERTSSIGSRSQKPTLSVGGLDETGSATYPATSAPMVGSDTRLSQAQANIECLGRCLGMLKDVRVKQSEYLHLLQGIPSPCTNK